MGSIVLKTFKWLIAVALFIIGYASLAYSQQHDIVRPLAITIISFGAIFIMYKTNSVNKKILFCSLGAIGLAFLLSRFVPINYVNPYVTWWLWAAAIGVPAMMTAYKKFT